MNFIELCVLESSKQLPQTTSLYSKRGLTKDFSEAVLLTLNLRALRRLRSLQAFSETLLTSGFQLYE